MKGFRLFLICLLTAAMFCGCASQNVTADTDSSPLPTAELPAVTPQPHMEPPARAADSETDSGTESVPADDYGASPGAAVTASVAYAFAGDKDGAATLYGAAEYTNTGDCPITIAEADFVFTGAGGVTERAFTPSFASSEVILPGESGFITLFLENTAGYAAGENVSLQVSLQPEKAPEERILMQADHIYLADNYPGFTTMTGSLSLPEEAECTLNTVYVGFYGESGELLGVWNFTKNAQFEGAGDTKNFTVHMRGLPIGGLAENTVSTKSAAFGVR